MFYLRKAWRSDSRTDGSDWILGVKVSKGGGGKEMEWIEMKFL